MTDSAQWTVAFYNLLFIYNENLANIKLLVSL